MAYVSPAASRDATIQAKPISSKKEFEKLIRDIRSIAAKTRVFSGDLVQELIKETNSSAESQKKWSLIGSGAQLASLVGAIGVLAKGGDAKETEQLLQMISKGGDFGQSACGAAQYGYQATSQKIQQALSHYNTFDQRMQSLVQSIDSAQQRLQQKEMEEASNR